MTVLLRMTLLFCTLIAFRAAAQECRTATPSKTAQANLSEPVPEFKLKDDTMFSGLAKLSQYANFGIAAEAMGTLPRQEHPKLSATFLIEPSESS